MDIIHIPRKHNRLQYSQFRRPLPARLHILPGTAEDQPRLRVHLQKLPENLQRKKLVLRMQEISHLAQHKSVAKSIRLPDFSAGALTETEPFGFNPVINIVRPGNISLKKIFR